MFSFLPVTYGRSIRKADQVNWKVRAVPNPELQPVGSRLLRLLGTLLLLLIDIVENVDYNNKLHPQFVQTDTRSTDDPTSALGHIKVR